MTRYKSLFAGVFLMLIVCSSCARVRIKDEEWLETRLRRRINQFSTYFLENELEKMWDMRSSWFKKSFMKEDYIEYLEGLSYRRSYYKYKVKAQQIEMKDKKAIATVMHIEQEKKDSKPKRMFSYYYWEFEDDDWYFIEESMAPCKPGWW